MRIHNIFKIVEDDADDLLYFNNTMKEIDRIYECLEAWNGAQALKPLYVAKQITDFIFIYISLSLVNWLYCLEKFKEDEKLKNIPLIIPSSFNYKKNNDFTLDSAASNFLTKSIDTMRLPQLIISAMERQSKTFIFNNYYSY